MPPRSCQHHSKMHRFAGSAASCIVVDLNRGTMNGNSLLMQDQPAHAPIRQMEETDLPRVIDLLSESFPRRTRSYWELGLARLGARPLIPERPRYGYVIDDNGIRGVVLAISSWHGSEAGKQIFTNISSWCVAPSHRGPLAKSLYAFAARDQGVTFTNLSAAPNTLRTITRLGFEPWSAGQLVGIGRGRSAGFGGIVSVAEAERNAVPGHEMSLLRNHQEFGCIAFCVRIRERLAPMIFLRRKVQRFVPCAQLIYCSHLPDFLHHSQPINRHLMRAGCPFLIVDSNGPAPEILGRYYPGRAAKYFKGPKPAADVDHTYSEMVYLKF
jgi:hypothetical protein